MKMTNSAPEWTVVRWQEGKVIEGEGTSSTARHLYKDTTWYGLLTGMTDDVEILILAGLNKPTIHRA